jgi:hypothetical protein
MARMIGNLRATGCTYGKHCTCSGMYRDAKTTRTTKRRERMAWKKEVASDI